MNKSIEQVSVSNPPSASVDDTAAYLRAAPVLTAVISILLPAKVPGRSATFAQQELRKLDADLVAETDGALQQLTSVDPATRAIDFGPTAQRLLNVDALVRHRADNAAVVARLRSLLDYATLDVLAARQSKINEGRARARAAAPDPTPL